LTPGRIRDETFKAISKDEEFAIYKEEVEYINNNYNLNTKFTFGIIVEMMRNKTDEYIKKTIEDSIELRRKYPDLICGIDLSGDENNFRTFQDLTPVMLNNTDPELPWILHCGESIKALNYNLVDGFLNNAKRFGHVINLFKLGNLWEIFKSKDIVFEINPISNQTLRQVRDLRLHPCIGYHNNGIKICINNDDPTIYNTKGVGYDYFAATAAMEFDLFDLKSFGLNSIDGAQISEELKKEYKFQFLNSWTEFIDYFIKKYGN
jgi:adenosine deaminase CECR1